MDADTEAGCGSDGIGRYGRLLSARRNPTTLRIRASWKWPLAPKPHLQPAFDAIVLRSLRPVAFGLGTLYLVFAAAHFAFLAEPARTAMTTVAVFSAFVLLVFAVVLGRRPFRASLAHPLAFGVALVVLGNTFAHLYFTRQPNDTTNLILMVIGAGCILLSHRCLVLVIVTAFGGWVLLGETMLSGPVWTRLEFGFITAIFLSAIVHAGRIRAYSYIETLRLQDEQRNRELEKALEGTRRELLGRMEVEADLEKARVELESRVIQRTQDLADANQALLNEIAERSRIEAALRKSQASLVLAQRIGRIGSWEIDLKTEQLTWSAETYRIFGCEPEKFTPSREAFMKAVHPDDRAAVAQTVMEAMTFRKKYDADHRIVRPDGRERVVHEQADLLLDVTGLPAQIAGTVQDVTEIRALEIQLRQSQKMEAVGQLAAGVAHDFNNLLTVMMGNLGLLREGFDNDANRSELLQEISQAAERAANLTRQLLLFSRKQVLQTRFLELNEIIGALSKILGRLLGEGIDLRIYQGDSLPMIEADPTMIEQVLVNLVVNSRHAMPQGGCVVIQTSLVVPTADQVKAHPEAAAGKFVRLSVEDTGCGIEPAVLPRIFEPFFTTRPVGSGTGLGLSTVYGITKQHKGWIEVQSELKRGTKFSVFFPAVTGSLEPGRDSVLRKQTATVTRRILVVDDEHHVRQLICKILRQAGYDVVEAESGPQAQRVWKREYEGIDLLLTDLVMPDGLSGQDLAEKLLQEKPMLKVIYISGYSSLWTELQSTLRPGIRFLAKPFRGADLLGLVRDCLGADQK